MPEKKADTTEAIEKVVNLNTHVLDWDKDVAQKCKALADELRDLEMTLIGRTKEILEVVGVGPITKEDTITKLGYDKDSIVIHYRHANNVGESALGSAWDMRIFTIPYHMLGITKA